MFPNKSLIFLLGAAMILATQSLQAGHEQDGDYVFTFGVVPQFEQRKLFRIWRPILDELEKRTGFAFHLKGSSKIPEFEKEFLAGNYDFAYMNPFHVLEANNQQGYLPLVRDGGRKLKGILVVKKESPYLKLSDLNEKNLAFPAPNALGASLLMRADLIDLHKLKFTPRYVKTHSSVYLHVAMGLTEAGGGVASTLRSQKPEVRDHLRVLYETRTMSPHPLTAHPRVPPVHREEVRQAILQMAQTKKGKALLAKIPMKKAIAAGMQDYEEIGTWGLKKFWED